MPPKGWRKFVQPQEVVMAKDVEEIRAEHAKAQAKKDREQELARRNTRQVSNIGEGA